MQNHFDSPFRGQLRGQTPDRQTTNPNISVGHYSSYSGDNHCQSFVDCARFLSPEPDVDRLIIGSSCSISSGAAFIMAGNQGHRHELISTFPFFWMPEIKAFAGAANGFAPAGDTVIGNDVWIGCEAIIMPGIHIADGAVIGSRAVVTRDVEPYAIVAINPAHAIR